MGEEACDVTCPVEGCSRQFGTERAMKIHNTQYHQQGKTDEELLEDLRVLSEELGRVPTKTDLLGREKYYTSPNYSKRFGSWTNAVKEAGLEPVIDRHGQDLECDFCGSIFNRPRFRQDHKQQDLVFCSTDCRVEHLAEKTGEDALGWIDGRMSDDDYYQQYQYGRLFRHNRDKVLKLDGFQCLRCGIPEDKHQEVFGTGLHAHHIQRPNSFDDEKAAHTVENLITLCAVCHRKIEKIPLTPQISHRETINNV